VVQSLRFTSADLALFPDDGKRYEIIDGELFVAKAPHAYHQLVCGEIICDLVNWDHQTRIGRTLFAPGVIFSSDNDVVPDIVWIRRDRLKIALDKAGHLTAAPDLMVEVLSPGLDHERRDRELKLRLYSVRGVLVYWIVDWRMRQIEVFRRTDLALQLIATLLEADVLTSPLLPGFTLALSKVFAALPGEIEAD
jgi:Uma2 family endonuclease